MYAYREAETMLDQFAEDPKRTHAYRRAYRKLKFMLSAYCAIDFDTGTPEERLSWVWEDLHAAAVGVGEPILHGAIRQLWLCLPTKQEEKVFLRTLQKAFTKAEECTPPGTPRRYLADVRSRKVASPADKSENPVLPLCGPLLREWAADHKVSPEGVVEEHFWFGVVDRNLSDKDAQDAYLLFLQEQNAPRASRPVLRLVPPLRKAGS